MKEEIYKILEHNLVGSYETKQRCADEILRLFSVSGSSDEKKKDNEGGISKAIFDFVTDL